MPSAQKSASFFTDWLSALNEKESCFFPISFLNLVSYYRLSTHRFQVNTNACRFPCFRKKVPGTDMSGSCCEAEEPLVLGTVLWVCGWKGVTGIHNIFLCPYHFLLQFLPKQSGLISTHLQSTKKIQQCFLLLPSVYTLKNILFFTVENFF